MFNATAAIFLISSVGVNATSNAKMELHFVTGTATGGSTLTPTNLNRSSANDAAATALGNSAVGSLTEDAELDHLYCTSGCHEEFRRGGRVRLGQNDAVALKVTQLLSNQSAHGVIFGYYE